MANLNINQIIRNGIYLNEYDNSIMTSDTIEGMRVLVVGSSRKGPINTPVALNSKQDLEKIFGTLDRNLERSGSYFHRTISKVLESTPVYAINLLKTDDVLDTLEYKSLSSTTSVLNGLDKVAPYRRFFNTTGFWSRDTESFVTLANSPVNNTEDTILNITNMGDRPITVFIFKSKLSGYDRPIVEWYSNNINNVPPYINPTDYASDYLVDVLVVAGDYTNYQELTVDSRFSNYFNNSGLVKSQVNAFYNDKNVTPLAYYSGLSLIPYFRDATGRVIYIESVINQETDKTGLFCAVNTDAISKEYNTGLLDLIGNNLVGNTNNEINFLSYRDTITESFDFTEVELDRLGNVISIANGNSPDFASNTTIYRNDINADGAIDGLSFTIPSSTVTDGEIGITSTMAYAIFGDTKVNINTPSTYEFIPSVDGTHYSYAYVNSNGDLLFSALSTNNNTAVVGNVILVGQFEIVKAGVDYTLSYIGNSIAANGDAIAYSPIITTNASGEIVVEFPNTNSTNPVYNNYRGIKTYNMFKTYLTSNASGKGAILINGNVKSSLDAMDFEFIESSGTNLKFIIKTNLPLASINEISTSGRLIIYKTDDEVVFANNMSTADILPTASNGIVARHSSLYQRYYNGIINSGDHFYYNTLTSEANIDFDSVNNTIEIDYVGSVPDIDTGSVIKFKNATLNTGSYTVASQPIIAGGVMTVEVVENIVSENILNENSIYDVNQKFYISCYLENGIMVLTFVDESGAAVNVSSNIQNGFNLISNLSNYKESIDLVLPQGYERQPNKILVNASRYNSVKIGDFLERNWVEDVEYPNSMPKKLTRIISKKVYAGDNTLVEITCDSEIKLTTAISGHKQATKYSTIENYVNTYKGIKLKGFKLRQDSLPNGTESRQDNILNLVAKGTPLFKSITNKESFDFRYLVDSYGLGLTERSKQQLVDIVGERLDAFAFINMPSAKQFKNSSSPSFVDEEGILQTEFIAKGGNPESNPAFLYSFASGVGTSCAGYFFPYVSVNDNGTPLIVPPAMYVADTYLRKYNSANSNIVPWTIAAGTTNGRVMNIVDTEMVFGNDDLDNFKVAQINPIVYKNNRGFVIDDECTSQIMYKSALSYIHTREVLIELEREIADMLKDYQYQFNTDLLRQEIKLKADAICEKYQTKNALYNFFNKCDSQNNTPELIDQGIAVLDTYVEVIRGMQSIVNNVTIMRTGGIQSAGFN